MSVTGTSAIDLTSTHLVDGAWLERHLGDPTLRILDATVILDPNSWEANSGRSAWAESHIPGSQFVDLIEELSDPAGDVGLPAGVHAYRLPSPEAFARAIEAHGVTNATPVVAYDTSAGMWAARLWWMLRVFGHENVAVLDGGWGRWVADGRPVSDAVAAFPTGTFVPSFRPGLLATKEQVAAASREGGATLVNALWPELFRGEAKTPLERPGRIPGSVNVPFTATMREDGTLQDADAIRAQFAEAGVDGSEPVITYCGGGIAASYDALALATLGIDAAVYDGSLVEWVADPALELETG